MNLDLFSGCPSVYGRPCCQFSDRVPRWLGAFTCQRSDVRAGPDQGGWGTGGSAPTVLGASNPGDGGSSRWRLRGGENLRHAAVGGWPRVVGNPEASLAS